MALLPEWKVRETIRAIPTGEFTVLEFADVLAEMYPDDWRMLLARFGTFGEKRRYTISTYLSNRLEEYSRKPASLLEPHPHYGEDRERGYRRPTSQEKRRFGSPWIAVCRKKRQAR
jgi:hypothetical protein